MNQDQTKEQNKKAKDYLHYLLEEIDGRDRIDGMSRDQRLRQIPPETGRFIAMLAAAAPDGDYIEVGTSVSMR